MSQKLRNRLVGLLVLISIIMIIIPAMVKPSSIVEHTTDSNTIAIDRNGAINDLNNYNDYNDLLAPVDDKQPINNSAQASSENPTLTTAVDDADPFAAHRQQVAQNNDPQPQNQSQSVNHQPLPDISAAEFLQGADPRAGEVLTANNTPAPVTNNQPKPAARQENPPANTPAAKPTPNTTSNQANNQSNKGKFAVQVGVYSQKDNAQRVIDRLKKAGINAKIENTTLNGKAVFRVVAGNANNRQDAQSLSTRISDLIGEKSRVIEL